MITRRTLALATAGLASAGTARAQGAWPERPVRFLIGFPPGGPTDLVGRLLQEPLQRVWGQPVIMENRPGASQIIASEAVARSAPDGYTLLLAASTHTSNVAVQQRLPYDTVADFTPICVLYGSPTVLFVSAERPWRTVQELVDAAKREPGMAFASSAMAPRATSRSRCSAARPASRSRMWRSAVRRPRSGSRLGPRAGDLLHAVGCDRLAAAGADSRHRHCRAEPRAGVAGRAAAGRCRA